MVVVDESVVVVGGSVVVVVVEVVVVLVVVGGGNVVVGATVVVVGGTIVSELDGSQSSFATVSEIFAVPNWFRSMVVLLTGFAVTAKHRRCAVAFWIW